MVRLQSKPSCISYVGGEQGTRFGFSLTLENGDAEQYSRDDIEIVVDSPLGVDARLVTGTSFDNLDESPVIDADPSDVYRLPLWGESEKMEIGVEVSRSPDIDRPIFSQTLTVLAVTESNDVIAGAVQQIAG